MKDFKFNLGFLQILQLLTLLGILTINFLGLNYISDGNLLICGIGVVVMGLFYFFSLKYTKDNKYEIHKQKFLNFFSIFFVVLFVLFIISWGLMSHFINVNSNCRNEITTEVINKLDLIDSASNEYKTRSNQDIQDYTINLRKTLDSFLRSPTPVLKNKLSSPPYSINTNILDNLGTINPIAIANGRAQAMELKMSTFQKLLDSSFKEKIEKKRRSFQNWRWFSIASSYKNINTTIDGSMKTINTQIQKLPIRNTPISFQLAKNDLDLDKPFILAKKYHLDVFWPMLIMIFLHLILLLDYYYTTIGKTEETEKITSGITTEW